MGSILCLVLCSQASYNRAAAQASLAPVPQWSALIRAHEIVEAAVLERIAFAIDGVESDNGRDPKMWGPEIDGPQGPMQVSAAAAADAGGGDRFNEQQNRMLGRAYLAQLYRRYRSWPDAVAAYNWGPGHMDSWISGGRPLDKLPPEVERYRVRVLVSSSLGAPRLRLVHQQPRRLAGDPITVALPSSGSTPRSCAPATPASAERPRTLSPREPRRRFGVSGLPLKHPSGFGLFWPNL